MQTPMRRHPAPDQTIATPGLRAIDAHARVDPQATAVPRVTPYRRRPLKGDPQPTFHDGPQDLRWGTAQTREMLREGLATDGGGRPPT